MQKKAFKINDLGAPNLPAEGGNVKQNKKVFPGLHFAPILPHNLRDVKQKIFMTP
jgi:hypothetical protein